MNSGESIPDRCDIPEVAVTASVCPRIVDVGGVIDVEVSIRSTAPDVTLGDIGVRPCTIEPPGVFNLPALDRVRTESARNGEPAVARFTLTGSAAGSATILFAVDGSLTQDGAMRIWKNHAVVPSGHQFFVGNDASHEVHRLGCPFLRRESDDNKRPFLHLTDALRAGYDGCGHCLPEWHSFDLDAILPRPRAVESYDRPGWYVERAGSELRLEHHSTALEADRTWEHVVLVESSNYRGNFLSQGPPGSNWPLRIARPGQRFVSGGSHPSPDGMTGGVCQPVLLQLMADDGEHSYPTMPPRPGDVVALKSQLDGRFATRSGSDVRLSAHSVPLTPDSNARFVVEEGMVGGGTTSFRLADSHELWLRHRAWIVRMESSDASTFEDDGSWLLQPADVHPVPGLVDPGPAGPRAAYVSFESTADPGSFLARRRDQLLFERDARNEFRRRATFVAHAVDDA